MPKQPGGITKFERVQALKDVLERWGRLGKKEIDQHVAAALKCPAEDLERALYRDLEELERLGEIVAIHYTRDGIELENYDPDVHRNTVCRWAIPGKEYSVLGGQRLRECQITFLAATRLREAFEVYEAKEILDREKISIYFQSENKAHCLRLSPDALPAKLILGRQQDDVKDAEIVALMESAFGKRASYLLVPVAHLSKAKDKNQPGHLSIEFRAPGKIVVRDLRSKNGTHYVPLDSRRAEGLVLELSYLGKATITDSASRFRQQMVPKPVSSEEDVELSLPVLIRASTAFELIIV